MHTVLGMAAGSLLYCGIKDKNPVQIIIGVMCLVCGILSVINK